MPSPFNNDSFMVPVSDAIRGAKAVLQLNGSQGSGNRFRSKSRRFKNMLSSVGLPACPPPARSSHPAWSANRDYVSACTRPAKQPTRLPAPAARFPACDSDNNSKTKLLSIGVNGRKRLDDA